MEWFDLDLDNIPTGFFTDENIIVEMYDGVYGEWETTWICRTENRIHIPIEMDRVNTSIFRYTYKEDVWFDLSIDDLPKNFTTREDIYIEYKPYSDWCKWNDSSEDKQTLKNKRVEALNHLVRGTVMRYKYIDLLKTKHF